MKFQRILKQEYMRTIIMIVVVILSVLVFWFGLSFVLGTENPVLAVASGSMEPVLYKGDLIIIEGVKNAANIYTAPKDANPVGDIIVFYQSYTGELIVHRAVEKNLNEDDTFSFKTWGDNNLSADPTPVQEKDVVGRYLNIKIPWLGNIALFFSSFEVKVAFVALWIIIIVIIELAPFVRKKVKRGSDEENLQK